MGCGFRSLPNGWAKFYRSLLLLPRGGRETISDVKQYEIEQGDDLQSAQNPDYAADLNSADPFDVAECTERSMPTRPVEPDAIDDPFRNVSLFKV